VRLGEPRTPPTPLKRCQATLREEEALSRAIGRAAEHRQVIAVGMRRVAALLVGQLPLPYP
jgi:hypothetical protein